MSDGKIASVEGEFLLAAALHLSDSQTMYHLATKISNLDYLTLLARKHGVLPLLYSRLAGLDTILPSDYLRQLRDEYYINVAQNLAAVSELIVLLDTFKEYEIPVLPFKGVAFGNSVYGDVALRPAGDLDLLIHRRDLPRASQVLREYRYELKTPVQADGRPVWKGGYEYHFERSSDGMIVEMRWRLTEPHFRNDWGMESLWPQKRSSVLFGKHVSVLSPEHTLILLCLHGSKHHWSRLIWICDVWQLLLSSPQLDWKQIFRDAKALGLSRTLSVGILLAVQLAGARVPGQVLQSLQGDSVASRVAQHTARSLYDDRQTDAGVMPYHALLLGFADRVWWAAGRFRPNENDRAMIHIPPALDLLYYLVRPLRLVRDRLME